MSRLKDERFLIVKKIKSFILNLESVIITFPKKDMITRNKIYTEALELYYYVLVANYESRKDYKHTYQIYALAKINLLDFYLERAYNFHYINFEQLTKKSDELNEINKMIYSWCIDNGNWS